MMAVHDLLQVVEALQDAGVGFWLDGGWGVDALVGEQTREHSDVDIALDRADLQQAESALDQLGYRHAAAVQPGLPARLVLTAEHDRQIDLHPLQIDPAGNGWQRLSASGSAWACYPADGLSATGTVAGRPVPCLSPQLQARFHLGYAMTDRDAHDLGLLSERFGVPLPPPGGDEADALRPPRWADGVGVKSRPVTSTLLLICGLPGAGRTTLEKRLEGDRRALRFTPDEWIARLLPEPFDRVELDRLRDPMEALLWDVAAQVLGFDVDVTLDFGFWARAEREDYRARAAALGAHSEVCFLDTPREELRRRLSLRNAALPAGTFCVEEADLDAWFGVFEPPTPDELRVR